MDWVDWHDAYDQPDSGLARRLATVQGLIRQALDRAPGGPVNVISVCAGQGRDLIGALDAHSRRGEVHARLVEIDPRNAGRARADATAAGLSGLDVVTGDAARIENYAGYVPAQLVLMCGVYGNVSDADIERTVGYCRQLCATGGTVIWTRGRWEPDLFPQICEWYEECGFERLWISDPEVKAGIGAYRFPGTPAPPQLGATMFEFIRREPRSGKIPGHSPG